MKSNRLDDMDAAIPNSNVCVLEPVPLKMPTNVNPEPVANVSAATNDVDAKDQDRFVSQLETDDTSPEMLRKREPRWTTCASMADVMHSGSTANCSGQRVHCSGQRVHCSGQPIYCTIQYLSFFPG